MIIKLVKEGGVSQLIACDDVLIQETARHAMDVEICRGGERQKRVLVGDRENETAEWHIAYVMEGGKTVDTIRQLHRPPQGTQIIRNSGGKPVAVRG